VKSDPASRRRPIAIWRVASRSLLVGMVSLAAVACSDDGPPIDQPATTVPAGGSATTVPTATPSGGSGDVEPGTNLVPTSDEVPGPSDPGGLGPDDTAETGG